MYRIFDLYSPITFSKKGDLESPKMAQGIPGFLEAEFEKFWSRVTQSIMQLWDELNWLRKYANIWITSKKYEIVGKITPA